MPTRGRSVQASGRWAVLPCLFLLTGCSAHPSVPEASASPRPAAPGPVFDTLAPGVVHRAIPTGPDGGIDLIDIDLAHTSARLAIAAESIKRVDGLVTGMAYTPHEWLDRRHALAATNGGYFGREVGADRKEIVGLLVQSGKVRRAAQPLHGHGGAAVRAGRYVRSAFGLSAQGLPRITWAATDAASVQTVRPYAGPVSASLPVPRWDPAMAVGCGPTLLHDGRIRVTDRQERLVSPGPKARTFVAYDGQAGAPRHFVLGMASGMTYQKLASFLASYFPRWDGTRPADAMCLDGGASTQLSYRLPGGTVQSPRETGVAVPDAILILPPPPQAQQDSAPSSPNSP